MKSFDDYVREIDLGEYLISHGYVLDKNKSAKNPAYGWMAYDRKGESGKSTETLLVKINNDSSSRFKGQFYYHNPGDLKDKGNLLHFICNRNGWTMKENWKELNEVLAKYTGEVSKSEFKPIAAPISKDERNQVVAQYYDLKPLSDRSYLKSRGISDHIIDSFLFKDKVYHNEIVHKEYSIIKDNKKVKLTGQEVAEMKAGNSNIVISEKEFRFINTVFPLTTEQGDLVGLEIKNNNFHGNAPDSQKANSLWFSNFEKNKPLDKIIIGESGVDLLSHFQLREDELKGLNVLYLSTNGNLAEGQINLIDRLRTKLAPAAGIILANDNDNAGIKNNIKIMGHITSSEGDNSMKFDIAKNGEYHFQISVKIQGENVQARIKDLEVSFQKFNSPGNIKFNVVQSSIVNGEGSIQIDTQASSVNLKTVEKILLKEKGLEKEFKIDRPANKDFNDDLREKLGIPFEKKTMDEAKTNNDVSSKKQGFFFNGRQT